MTGCFICRPEDPAYRDVEGCPACEADFGEYVRQLIDAGMVGCGSTSSCPPTCPTRSSLWRSPMQRDGVSLHETRTPSMIVGVDPGKSGALARLDHAGRLVDVADMPVVGTIISAHLLDEIVHNWIDPLADAPYGTAVIEDVHARPGQGVSSMFSFGRALGVAEGVLAGNGLSLRYVSPAKWKKALGLSADKGVSRRRAIELWPDHRKAFERVKDDGRAEAALLAWWWWKHEAGR